MPPSTALLAALALAACAQQPTAVPPAAPVAAGPAITVDANPVPLNAADPAADRIGDFRYAGGLVLTSTATARLHGLSDMAVRNGADLTAVCDEGDLLKARLVLDAGGRLIGLTDARLSFLAGEDGKPLPGKLEADSEGLALMESGDMLVSFEQRHRIWRYPADGAPPRPAPSPDAAFPPNGGMEALGPDPFVAPDAYMTGGEESGQVWSCRLSAACTPAGAVAKPSEFGLVALARLSATRTAWLLRAWDPLRGSRITLTIREGEREVARLDLSRPYTVDNFEALAAVPAANGTTRFYLLSDDNFQSSQRTLLLAFDWTPGA
ncbi:esterase-like activity of phytase family protein [Phenylobacterium koreense]|uniref:Phytase-like domain-containing protein n=1 Tax=Phenylobacterium koreense TaxID=266125 RepID=A0ABV2ENC0_9CAUL